MTDTKQQIEIGSHEHDLSISDTSPPPGRHRELFPPEHAKNGPGKEDLSTRSRFKLRINSNKQDSPARRSAKPDSPGKRNSKIRRHSKRKEEHDDDGGDAPSPDSPDESKRHGISKWPWRRQQEKSEHDDASIPKNARLPDWEESEHGPSNGLNHARSGHVGGHDDVSSQHTYFYDASTTGSVLGHRLNMYAGVANKTVKDTSYIVTGTHGAARTAETNIIMSSIWQLHDRDRDRWLTEEQVEDALEDVGITLDAYEWRELYRETCEEQDIWSDESDSDHSDSDVPEECAADDYEYVYEDHTGTDICLMHDAYACVCICAQLHECESEQSDSEVPEKCDADDYEHVYEDHLRVRTRIY
jgi:hypothetical protein